jgi:peptide/nickel transport system substrate-binding protein
MSATVRLFLFVTLVLALLAGCAPAAAPAAQPATDAAGTEAEALAAAAEAATGTRELVVGHHVDPTTLDPVSNTTAAFQSVTAATIEQLIYFEPSGSNVVPGLAESWEFSDDGLALTLHLKEGVTFHNGEPFDAEAAKFSIEQLKASVPYERWVQEFGEVDVVDDHTVRLNFTEPTGFALAALARGSYVFPPAYYTEVGTEGFGLNPVGTGPYKFVEWVKDDHITFEANDGWWGGAPALDRITWRVIPEDAARLAALQTGEVHLITNVSPGQSRTIREDEALELVSIPGVRIFVAYMDSRLDHPVANPTVRRALNYAVDKEGLIALFDGEARALQGQYLLPGIMGFDETLDPFAYDPEKAKELLAEAGYPDGFEMTLKYTIDRYPLDREMGETVAAYLEAVGITVEQVPLEYGEFRRQHVEEESMGPAWMWGLATPSDPHMMASLFGQGSVYTRFPDDQRIFDLIDQGMRETDPAAREQIYKDLMRIWNEEPLGIYLIVPNDLYGLRAEVEGFVPRTDQVVDLSTVSLAQ